MRNYSTSCPVTNQPPTERCADVRKVLNQSKLPKESPMSKPESKKEPLAPEQLRKINAYWRAANYLSVGQIYLYDNPLLRVPLKLSHVKPLVVGHWGTT